MQMLGNELFAMEVKEMLQNLYKKGSFVLSVSVIDLKCNCVKNGVLSTCQFRGKTISIRFKNERYGAIKV